MEGYWSGFIQSPCSRQTTFAPKSVRCLLTAPPAAPEPITRTSARSSAITLLVTRPGCRFWNLSIEFRHLAHSLERGGIERLHMRPGSIGRIEGIADQLPDFRLRIVSLIDVIAQPHKILLRPLGFEFLQSFNTFRWRERSKFPSELFAAERCKGADTFRNLALDPRALACDAREVLQASHFARGGHVVAGGNDLVHRDLQRFALLLIVNAARSFRGMAGVSFCRSDDLRCHGSASDEGTLECAFEKLPPCPVPFHGLLKSDCRSKLYRR